MSGFGGFLIVATTIAGIYAILAIGLNLQLGLTGLANFGHVAFFAVGAFTTALVTLPSASGEVGSEYLFGLGAPWIVAVPIAVAATSLFALVIGYIGLRAGLNELYLGISTLALAEIVRTVLEGESGLVNGFVGLNGIPQPFSQLVADTFGSDAYDKVFLGLVLAVVGLVWWFGRRVANAPYGRILRAIREDPTIVSSLGHDVLRYRVRAFVLGAGVAGLAGSLWAGYLGSIAPQDFVSTETFLVLAIVIIGGSGNMSGSVLGAVIVMGAITEGTRFVELGVDPQLMAALRQIAIGLMFILVLRFRPAGLLPEPRRKYPDRPLDGARPLPAAEGQR